MSRPCDAENELANDAKMIIAGEVSGAVGSALAMIAAFPPRISHAAILLSVAFAEAEVEFPASARIGGTSASRPATGITPLR